MEYMSRMPHNDSRQTSIKAKDRNGTSLHKFDDNMRFAEEGRKITVVAKTISGVATEIRDDKAVASEIRDSDVSIDDTNGLKRDIHARELKKQRRHRRARVRSNAATPILHPIESIYLEMQNDFKTKYEKLKMKVKKAEKRYERMRRLHTRNRRLRGKLTAQGK
eukprot:g13168.t1